MTSRLIAFAVACSVARIGTAWADKPAPPAPEPAPPAPEPAPVPPAAPETSGAPATPPAEPGKPAEPPKTVRIYVADTTMHRRGLSPDLALGFGIRAWNGDNDQTRWWTVRARAGIVMYNEPSFLSVGIAGQIGALDSAALGVEAQYSDLWHGFWFGGEAFVLDRDGGATVGGFGGYALFGLDYQRRVSGSRSGDQALVVMLQIPLGIIRVASMRTPGVIEVPADQVKMK